ncbi:MAG: 3-oxoacyl-ACP synthase III [Desulfuromonadales bacterium]|nr:3-oxoacyl-ACP synthase III [Desulfuromonadales bacterium]
MKYSKVYIKSIGYELAPVVVTSTELESRLEPLYKTLHFTPGQLYTLTGINERRWWEPGSLLSDGATVAAEKAIENSGVKIEDIGALVYTGVCREQFEPATACRVASNLGIHGSVPIYDISNACLGVLNGILDIANRIELGQIRAGLIVSCESAREINELMINRMLEEKNMERFASSLATLTGGSGAVAVLLTDGSFPEKQGHKLLGGVTEAAPEHHGLCLWGISPDKNGKFVQTMSTDGVNVMNHGVELGKQTWENFLKEMNWSQKEVDKVVCHQVGSTHQAAILKALNIDPGKDFTTYESLGNIGTVSLPITLVLAAERDEISKGNKVGLLGIGSGLNCLMLGVEW